jgi:ATP synthase I chain
METQDTGEVERAQTFYSGALLRIRRFMLGLTPAFVLLVWWRLGWRMALGLACGCAIAYLNFHWLKRGVEGLADRIVATGKSHSTRGIVARFLVRYVLMAVGAYVILTVSPASLYGLLAGLFLPVAAIACEAAYEAYVALARGI